jgi:radical SAM superfamily enzyme YgiQ (UPF0313 family)
MNDRKSFTLTASRPQITQLDQLPFVDRSFIDYEKYNSHTGQAMVKNCLSLQATRGCPYKCVYCHKIWPKSHFVRSAENIFEEVKLYYDMGVRRFSFIDDIFNLNIKNSSRFFELILKNRLDVQLFFPGGFRGDILTKPFIDLMVEAGTLNIAMALETASPRLQKVIKKYLNIEKLKENLEYVCLTHPHVILELFTIIGIPTETEEEAMMTLDFIKQLKWLHFPYVNILKIFPNTEMEQLALENGISTDDIKRSLDLAYDEISNTLPFRQSFARWFQSECLHGYVLRKERLKQVFPFQMKVLTQEEMVQKYASYMPGKVDSFAALLQALDLEDEDFSGTQCPRDADFIADDLDLKIRRVFPPQKTAGGAIKVLLLDISQYFSDNHTVLYDVYEPPLGLMYLLSYLKQQKGDTLHGRIAKSRMDYDSYDELQALIDQYQPHVIGVRSLSLYKEFFHETVSKIRQWGFDGPIIAGGPYPTSEYNTIFDDGCIDLVVLGEGEVTFDQLIQAIRENGNRLPDKEILKEMPGLALPNNPGDDNNHDGSIEGTGKTQQDTKKVLVANFNDELDDE